MVINMNNVYNEPKYDTDPANKGYVDSQSQHIINVINGVEEDTNNKLNGKTQNFGSQPTPPYRVNDTWMNGTDIYICINERLIGNFVASDWKKASTYDNTKSILDGGVTTNGTLVVARGGTVAAGLTAYTEGDDGVRIWAGSDINGINNAPFRVTQKGYLYASNANISGTITSNSATISGGSIRIDSSENINSKLAVYHNEYSSNVFYNHLLIWKQYGNSNVSRRLYLGFGDATDPDGDSPMLHIRCVLPGAVVKYQSFVYDRMIQVLDENLNESRMEPTRITTPKIVAGNMDCGTCTLNSSSDTTV